ncbi:serine/threonine protein kinase [Intrasporangium oryzae NRRL B-24470]|uniref:non-specific serine/threonine protein kinase n=1 Tax=Intrasporangium oryzae NRRL B-24470 TaxID=1386089 RepID=W9G8C5_9MICO|nr:serine/threonine-protein kinase [Intrasporangium oryzae]EWT01058.1 serine/threonine protein kinase [Intrasporangium oryzae NRRL B-24470]
MSRRDDVVDGRYRLLERIGTGGMGFVWRATDERLGRDVAVKQLHLAPGYDEAESEVWRQRAMREARITARLHHPNAVAVFDVVANHGEPCLVMEYVPSRSLHEILRERRTLPPVTVARIGSEVASALAAAHDVGIVHRDVKPGNVLIAADGTAKISDFGIAHALGDVSLTSTGMVTGTPAYLAPEVARGGDSTPASDVFSLGATLYAALEGAPPFGTHENPMALLHRVASGTIMPPAEGGPLTPLLLHMLAPEPGDRPSMDEVARLLRGAPAGSAEELGTTLVLPEAPVPGTEPSAGRAAPTATVPVGATGAAEEGARGATHPPHEALAAALLEPAGPRRGEAGTEPPDRHRRRDALVGLALLVALAVLVLAVRSLQVDAPTPARAAGSSSAGTSTSPSPRPSSSAPTARPSTSTPPRSSPSTSAPASGAGAPTAAQLARAVEDYYAVLPDNLDAGWARLTERYQRTTSKNRETYAAFWGSIDRVGVSDAAGSPPGSATATVTYHFSDGRIFVERTSFGMVEQDGVLKIDRSKVLSSTQR